MSFWFYNIEMLDNYKVRCIQKTAMIKTLEQLSQSRVEIFPAEAQNTLGKIKCLQQYLLNTRPTIITKDLYCGEIRVILKDSYNFCYVDMLDEIIIIRGILYKTYVEYEYNKVKMTGDLNIHTLYSDETGNFDEINSTIFTILEKIMKKHNIVFNRMEMF